MTDYVVNWSAELSAMRRYVEKGAGVLHVVGRDRCRPTTFMEHFGRLLVASGEGYKVCTIDPSSMLTSTPLGALRRIAQTLGVTNLRPVSPVTTINVASHLGAPKGDIEIRDVDVDVIQQVDEVEELARISDLLFAEIERGNSFNQLIILFLECHLMDDQMRRVFYSSVWKSLVDELVKKGAQTVFQYCSERLSPKENMIPPFSANRIDLPLALGETAVPDLARIVLELEFESTEQDAATAARTLLRASESVEDLYGRLMHMELRSV